VSDFEKQMREGPQDFEKLSYGKNSFFNIIIEVRAVWTLAFQGVPPKIR
jgi:hypothetical protein